MRRLIWLPIAGFLLIAGATIAAAAPTVTPAASKQLDTASSTIAGQLGNSAGTELQADDQTQNQNADDWPGAGPGGGALLSQVLSDLVGQNVISQDQADAITKALQDKADQLQTQMQQQRQLIQGFLQDGVITQDEVDQLPADSPFRQVFDSIAKDGQVTVDQLRQLGGFGDFGRGHGIGPGMGPFQGPWSDDDSNNNSNSNPSGGSSSSSSS